MRKLLFAFLLIIVLISCEVPVQETEKKVYVTNTVEELPYTFTRVSVSDQTLWEDWVYAENNNDEWITLDLSAKVGSNSYDCIAVIRIEVVDSNEIPEPTEWLQGKIRKPISLLEPYDFIIFKDVQIYEGILWADENGQLEIKYDFGWPYEKGQQVKVSFMQYAKTK